MESYLTAKEAAEYLKLAERTLVRLAHEGKIPGVKIGGQWRFRRALLDEYLDTLASESVATSGTAPNQVIDAPMEEIFTVGQIIPNLKANNRPEVIHAMSEHVTGLGLVEDQISFPNSSLRWGDPPTEWSLVLPIWVRPTYFSSSL